MRSRRDLKDKNLIEKGFTLVELLVVIVILGVLAAVVVFAVGGITNTSKASACTIEVRTINTATQAYYAQNQSYPAGTTAAQLITQLQTAKLISSGTGSASSVTGNLATYAPLTGVYASPICP
jgi:prepilin-type N-terminal cleavage/methylation domain-containing protein